MKIVDIEKAVYRKKLKLVSIAFVAVFAILSLIFGSIFIMLFASPELAVAGAELTSDDVQSNFRYNLGGVILALATMAMIANSIKNKPYFTEIYYIWQLKQVHNQIYRKLAKIKAKQIEGDESAKIILAFYYKTIKMVYELDDNTLTISNVNLEINKLQQQFGTNEFDELADKFDKSLVTSI